MTSDDEDAGVGGPDPTDEDELIAWVQQQVQARGGGPEVLERVVREHVDRSLSLYYDRQGEKISMLEWARRFEDYAYKRVARTMITSAADPETTWHVSTVWLGTDHGFGGGPPVIFETMVFAPSSSLDRDCHRYCTEAEARQGHDEVVTLVAATMEDPVIVDVTDREDDDF